MSAPATPPVWNVRIVSCVPGSPIDWAAMIRPRRRSRPSAGREEGAVAQRHSPHSLRHFSTDRTGIVVVRVLAELLDDLRRPLIVISAPFSMMTVLPGFPSLIGFVMSTRRPGRRRSCWERRRG
jgi:hypothetical protein